MNMKKIFDKCHRDYTLTTKKAVVTYKPRGLHNTFNKDELVKSLYSPQIKIFYTPDNTVLPEYCTCNKPLNTKTKIPDFEQTHMTCGRV